MMDLSLGVSVFQAQRVTTVTGFCFCAQEMVSKDDGGQVLVVGVQAGRRERLSQGNHICFFVADEAGFSQKVILTSGKGER